MPSKETLWLQDFIDRSQDSLPIVETSIIELHQGDSDVMNALLRSVVSIHAEAEMLGANPIEEVARHLVRALKYIRDERLPVNLEVEILLLELFDILADLFERSVSPDGITEANARDIQLALNAKALTLEASLELLHQPIQLFSEIEQIFPFKSAALRAAADYGKQVVPSICGGDLPIPQIVLYRLPRLLTHLLNNAIAHGIESPAERIAAGKSPDGHITLRAIDRDRDILITFEDDGAGINTERVKTKAIAKGLIDTVRAASLTPAQTYEFLFHPDFTTREVRDMRAGTGYGLDIVRSELQKSGGRIQVTSKPGKGTIFAIVYPKHPQV